MSYYTDEMIESEGRCPRCHWPSNECLSDADCAFNRKQNAKWRQERADRMAAAEIAAGERAALICGLSDRPTPEAEK